MVIGCRIKGHDVSPAKASSKTEYRQLGGAPRLVDRSRKAINWWGDGGRWMLKAAARFDGKKGTGRGPYIGQGVRGVSSKDSRPLYLQSQVWFKSGRILESVQPLEINFLDFIFFNLSPLVSHEEGVRGVYALHTGPWLRQALSSVMWTWWRQLTLDGSRRQGEHGCVTMAGKKGIRALGWAARGTWAGVE
jgi:hypothetical protein